MNLKKCLIINTIIVGVVVGFIGLGLLLYLWLIPAVVSSPAVHSVVKKEFYKLTKADIVIENPALKTSLSPFVGFSIDKLEINKGSQKYLVVNDLDTSFSFANLMRKRVELRKLNIPYFFCDVSGLMNLFPANEEVKEPQPCDWQFGFFDSEIDVSKVKLLYNANGVVYDVNVGDIVLSKGGKKNFLHFVSRVDVKKGKHVIHVSMKDDNKIFIERDKLVVDNCDLRLNESVVNLDIFMDKKGKYNFDVYSKGFKVENVIDIIESNILLPNGSELLAFFSDIRGEFDFRIKMNNKGIDGNIDVKRARLGLVPIDNIPVAISKGNVKITSNDIYLKDFVGHYENKPINEFTFSGSVKDYMKTFDTNIDANALVTNDFMANYLSKMVGYPIALVGQAQTKLGIKMKNNIIDLKWYFWINPDSDILVGGEPLGKYRLQRVLAADMQIKDLILNIQKLNYYVKVPNTEEKIYKKILNLNGKIDFSKDIDFREMGFEIEEPLPSEFLNMVARCDLFKGGTVVGKLKAIDGPKGVKLFGDINLSKIRVPSQRIYVEKGELATTFNTININANGRYRRTKYNLDGEFVNNIAFPIVVNKLALGIDKINIEKMLTSMNMQGQAQTQTADLSNDDDVVPTFDVSNLIIKDCSFKLNTAIYKDLKIDDLNATLTLDENSMMHLHSNKFGFASGTTNCKVCCDLKNHLYKVRLGVKDVDSNAVASSLLNLKDEISGKARGLIELNTDDSLKLNGSIKFDIKDGTIGTVGFLQYVLNVASVFRNPLAMISPATIYDLVNIPEGNFSAIYGSLDIKNNVVQRINIKSSAPLLSAYIAGRYDLDHSDASLRIYTKFSNKDTGLCGFLRYISLNTVVSKLPLTSRTLYNFYNQEVKEIPDINADEKFTQIFLTKVEGDVEHNNFISSLIRIK